jgi:clathrin heavy chain
VKYLEHVQRENVLAVNEALNEFYMEEEDFKKLRNSVDQYKDFDQVSLAQKLEKHELLEFRRIAAYVYKLNKRYEASIRLSKKDKLWKDAMETTAAAGSQEQAEELARFFVEEKLYEAFAASLYACYGLIRPDVVLELAWRNNLMDFAMPFMVQTLREYHNKMNLVFAKFDTVEQKAVEKEAEENKKAEEMAAAASFQQPLAIGAPPGMVGYDNSGMGMAPGGMMPMGGRPGGFPPQGGGAGFFQ